MNYYVLHHDYLAGEFYDEVKLIGIFQSRVLALEAAETLINEPGFRDHPNAFTISEYSGDQLYWKNGFVELQRGEDFLDVPAWVIGSSPDESEAAIEFAERMMNKRYGIDSWPRGADTEFRQIVRWVERGFEVEIEG